MTRIVRITAHHAGDADEVFQPALQFSEMAEAMAGLATYSGLPASDTAHEGDRIVVDVTFQGFFTVSGHTMLIERLDKGQRIIQSREHGKGIARWDHTLSIQPAAHGCVWTDTVIINAGWRTPFVARFAAWMYARRHRRRKALSVRREIFDRV